VDGWVLAGLLLLGASFLAKPRKVESGSTTQPSDQEIGEVADFAVLHEQDAQVLRDLAAAMRVLPMGTPEDATYWNRRRAALESRAKVLDVQTGAWRAHYSTGDAGIKAPRVIR